MIPSQLLPFANHLWQSTLFAAVASLLTLAFRKNRAQIRYSLWLAASVKFLVPFSLLIVAGSYFGSHNGVPITGDRLSSVVAEVSQPFAAPVPLIIVPATRPVSRQSRIPIILCVVWGIGFVTVASSWLMRWQNLRAVLRTASPLPLDIGIPVMTSPEFPEPGVYGILRPVLLLPSGIANQLTGAQLQAILAHELFHIRRHDNLATMIHMAVEALFWFHPLVWWLGAQLMKERERACDEEVLRMGNEPQAYAEGILRICELYLESPLRCVAGVTGANLKQRIEAIMANRCALRLSLNRRVVLVTAGVAALTGPVVIGVMIGARDLTPVRAQSPTAVPSQPHPEKATPSGPTSLPAPTAMRSEPANVQPQRLEAYASFSPAAAENAHDALVVHGTLPKGQMSPPPGVSQDEYSRRLAYVQANLGSDSWAVRRTYLRYGPPDQIDDRTSDAQNPSHVWRYAYLDEFRSSVEFQFTEKNGARIISPLPVATIRGVPGVDAALAKALIHEGPGQGDAETASAAPGFPGGRSMFQTYPAGGFQVLSVPLDALSGPIDILGQIRAQLNTGEAGQISGVVRDSKPASAGRYQASFTLEAGIYVCGVIVREQATGRMYGETISFEVK